MLSWDDFRYVKAIADGRSLAAAARTLGLNHSTVFRRLSQIEERLGARLFKRNRSAYTLTSQGDAMVRLAARMQDDIAGFEQNLKGKSGAGDALFSGLVPLDAIMGMGGLEFLSGMVAGTQPQPPMAATLGFRLIEVAAGRAVFEGLPEVRHYNPIGTVHGGFAATLLDSALGCAVFSTMAKGEAWTTLELKFNLVRPITQDTGAVRAAGRIVHRGRTVATADGDLRDQAGKLYAHASTTCMVFPAKG